jgi:hypothetical protein
VKLTKPRKKDKKEKESRREKKREREPRKIAGRDGGQSKSKPDNQTFKGRHKTRIKKKTLVQEQWNFRLSCSDVTPLASRPVCVS